MGNSKTKVRKNAQNQSVPENNKLRDHQDFRNQKSSTFNKDSHFKPRNNQRSETKKTTSTWMYLGRLKLGTTKEDIQSYLSETFPGHKFVVESLPLYKNGKLPCFKVLVDNSILNEFQDLDHWPQGVTLTKYIHNFKHS